MKHRRDLYCYSCKKYYKDVNTFRCPKCNSEDADVYPYAEYFNRDIEKKMLHREAYATKYKCNKCGSCMMYRNDGYEKLLICRNTKCNNFVTMKHLKNLGIKLTDIVSPARILFYG